jgi:UDP-N-acetylglucosamine 1-carboxyvinyltransferase
VDVDDLSSMYSIANRIWIDFKIIDKHTIRVNSFNKKNYKAIKLETRIYPGFPTDLQSIFGTLLTQANWVSKIFETLFEWRFGYLSELENLWAKVEILNPHQAIVIWPVKLKWWYVTSTDLRWWWAMVLAWIMAKWTTNIMNENIILRWYDNIVENLQNIWVDIVHI